MSLPELAQGLLEHDVDLLRRLRAEGLLLELRPLDALVQLRRARSLGEGDRRLVEAIQRLEAAPSRRALVPREPRSA